MAEWHDMSEVAGIWVDWYYLGLMPRDYQAGESTTFLVKLLGLESRPQGYSWSILTDVLNETHPGLIEKLKGPHGLTILKALIARKEHGQI